MFRHVRRLPTLDPVFARGLATPSGARPEARCSFRYTNQKMENIMGSTIKNIKDSFTGTERN